MNTLHGLEWIVEAYGCAEATTRNLALLEALFRDMIRDLGLHPVRETIWHQFPASFGVTGLCLLSESHLACHTFPEYGSICVNLFCCRERPDWPFERELKKRFEANEVSVRRLERRFSTAAMAASVKPEASRR